TAGESVRPPQLRGGPVLLGRRRPSTCARHATGTTGVAPEGLLLGGRTPQGCPARPTSRQWPRRPAPARRAVLAWPKTVALRLRSDEMVFRRIPSRQVRFSASPEVSMYADEE